MNQKNNGGFTLVELVIAMVTGSLVFIAASTLLLLGLRINNLTTHTSQQLNNTRTVMTVLERMATEGNITGVTYGDDGDSWTIKNGEKIVLSYSAEEQVIVFGKLDPDKKTDPVLDNVYAAHAILEPNNVLTLAVETKEGTFRSSVYCRLIEDVVTNQADTELRSDQIINTDASRQKFLEILYGQYRLLGITPNQGVILYEDTNGQMYSSGTYYAEWYIGSGGWGQDGWNKDTPWCACYISYCISQLPAEKIANQADIRFANVDLFIKYFEGESWKKSAANGGTYKPLGGDIIFFDWTGGNDPAHVGVVLKVENGKVYTIEGNSAGVIALRAYDLNDARIIGYGVLPWQNP